jgi:hypothetical protein
VEISLTKGGVQEDQGLQPVCSQRQAENARSRFPLDRSRFQASRPRVAIPRGIACFAHTGASACPAKVWMNSLGVDCRPTPVLSLGRLGLVPSTLRDRSRHLQSRPRLRFSSSQPT